MGKKKKRQRITPMSNPVEESRVLEEAEMSGVLPVVELVIHNAGVEIRKMPTPTGEMTLVRLHTPAMIFTIKLDDGGVNALVQSLRGVGTSEIQIARPDQVPGLR